MFQVQSYLQSAQYVTNKGKVVRDELYDNILERELNTKPWHPPVEEEELPDEGEDPEGVYDFLYEDRLYPKGKPPTGRKWRLNCHQLTTTTAQLVNVTFKRLQILNCYYTLPLPYDLKQMYEKSYQIIPVIN